MDAGWKVVIVGEDEFWWQLRHGWVVDSGRRLKGISVAVRRAEQSRELIVDFPFAVFGVDRSPSPSAVGRALVPAVRAALGAGWRPDERGRPFRFAWSPDD